jgi:two-component system cell cycle sensor histidine kinase/response regulator CckA
MLALGWDGPDWVALLAAGGAAAVAAALLVLRRRGGGRRASAADDAVGLAIADDPASGLLTDGGGRILHRNPAAEDRPEGRGADVTAALEPCCAVPGETVARLCAAAAEAGGQASETLVTPEGRATLSLRLLGPDRQLWRLTRPSAPDPVAPAPAGPPAVQAEMPAPLPAPPSDDLFERLPVALLRLDPGGRVRRANRRARALVPALEKPNPTLAAVVEGLGRSVGQWVQEASAGRGLNRPETLHVTGSSPDRYVQVTLTRPVTAPEPGLEGGLVAVLHDATELKILEGQFVQSQKMQAIGQLAGGIAHDFNNLLTAISGHCNLLLLDVGEDDPRGDDLRQISQNAARAAALVRQLLAFSRKQKLTMRDIDLREALGDMIHLLDRLVGDRVRLRLEHGAALLPVRTDLGQLEQVIMNLVVNARDAMPAGGTIRIRTACRFLSEPMERDRVVVPTGQYVCLSVEDEGVGIPADQLARIFEPFFTTKEQGKGTGLGLAMSYGVMKQSGGYIFVDSRPGRGATFTLYFPAGDALAEPAPAEARIVPLRRAAQPPAPREETAQAAAGRRPRILLVEDEVPVRAFAARVLDLEGFDVVEACDGEEALEILAGEGARFDAFVTDVMMPGLDGPSWVAQALETHPDMHTVFMSGYAEDVISESRAPTPNSIFLAKPFALEDLTIAVRDAVARREGEPEAIGGRAIGS